MKRLLALLLALCAIALCACGGETGKEPPVEYADQEEFLKDMAAGITARLENDEDSSAMNAEELAALYQKLVGCELEKIAKYQDLRFEDEAFDELAHTYIRACQTQLYATDNYKNKALHDALWNGARTIRAGIIIEMYSRYGLPITSEQAASYESSTSYTISFTPSTPDKGDEKTDYLDCISAEQIGGMWNEHYINADYYHYDLVVTNNTADCDLEVTVSALFYDAGGNVVGSDRETLDALGKGESQYCELKTDVLFSKAEYKFEKADKGHQESGIGQLSFTVTTPGGKVMVAATNKGDSAVEWGNAYCVFYNGNTIVDVENAYFATSSDPMEPGETQYAECSTKKSYTRYELYYYARK